jgi:hypothetical protein
MVLRQIANPAARGIEDADPNPASLGGGERDERLG